MPVKVKFTRGKSVPEAYVSGFQDRPTQALAIEAFRWFKEEGIPRESWSMAGLVGLFIQGYQDRFKRKLSTLGASFFVEVVTNLATLVIRVGMRDAVDAVEAVFSEDLRWVSSSHHKFLLNEANYAKYLIPVMSKLEGSRRPAGEQSEWTGDSASPGAEEVEF